MEIIVRIIQLNTEIQSFAMAPGSTVGQLFQQAGRTFVSGEVMRRTQRVSEDTVLYNGDDIVIAKMVKGNLDPFEVEIFRLGGGRSISLPATDGMTIKSVIEQLQTEERAQFFLTNGQPRYEFRISGVNEAVSADTVLVRPTSGKIRVICSQVVKGNFVSKVINFLRRLAA
jgi:hypothetical protein